MINSLESTDVATRWIAALNDGDRDALGRLCAADVTVHAPTLDGGALTALDRALAPVELYRAAFPDGRFRVEDASVDGTLVRCRWVACGSHCGRFLHVAPTNREVVARGSCQFRSVNGQVVEHWFTVDLYGILEQLGSLASEPGCGDPAARDVAAEAIRIWIDALSGGPIPEQAHVFDPHVVVCTDGFGSRSTRRGRAALADVAAGIRSNLFDIEARAGDPICQGRTVTYRGELLAKSVYTGDPARYGMFSMFETRARAIAACWIRLVRSRRNDDAPAGASGGDARRG